MVIDESDFCIKSIERFSILLMHINILRNIIFYNLSILEAGVKGKKMVTFCKVTKILVW